LHGWLEICPPKNRRKLEMTQPPLDPKKQKDLLNGTTKVTLEHYPSHPRPQVPLPKSNAPTNDKDKK
ncbi:TPA: hypothetical protein ACXP3I_005402, partial [Klebsiella pneumoniae]